MRKKGRTFHKLKKLAWRFQQPGEINHDMRVIISRTMGSLHFQCGHPARHVGMVQHRQVERTQAHQRSEQAFSGPISQAKQGLEPQAGQDCHIRARPRIASADRSRQSPVPGNARITKPDHKVAAMEQRKVVFRSALHPVAVCWLRQVLVYPGSCGQQAPLSQSDPCQLSRFDIKLR